MAPNLLLLVKCISNQRIVLHICFEITAAILFTKKDDGSRASGNSLLWLYPAPEFFLITIISAIVTEAR